MWRSGFKLFPVSEASILVNLNISRTPQVSSNKAAEDRVVGFGTVDLFSLTVDGRGRCQESQPKQTAPWTDHPLIRKQIGPVNQKSSFLYFIWLQKDKSVTS